MHPKNGGTAMMRSTALISLQLREGEAVRAPHHRLIAKLSGLHARTGVMILLAVMVVHLSVVDASSQTAIDTERSVLTVRVYKEGMLSSFGHEHTIRAPMQNGTFDEESRTVTFVVDARALRVLDPDVSDKDRAEIQATMVGPKVLDTEQFHEIRFLSTEVSPSSDKRWTVLGNLTLHGQTRPVKVEVERQEGRYRGSVRLRQSEFGITPVKVAGGTIKVKDEVRVEFEVVGR